jgi:hypothetical protein
VELSCINHNYFALLWPFFAKNDFYLVKSYVGAVLSLFAFVNHPFEITFEAEIWLKGNI